MPFVSARRATSGGLGLGLVVAVIGCAGSAPPLPPEHAQPLAHKPVTATEAPTPSPQAGPAWAAATTSPRPGSTPDPELAAAEEACGVGDASLHEVAQWLAEHFNEHPAAVVIDYANFHLRRTGSPYVMPRLWSAQMSPLDGKVVGESVGPWARQRPPLGEFRCGVGAAPLDDGTFAVIVLQADVLADVDALPTSSPSGTWLEFEADMLVPATDAKLLLLPPAGLPRTLATKLEGSTIKARLPIETSGTWLVQLMATVSGGPRPVAQMYVTADEPLPSAPDERPVPGEQSIAPDQDTEDALLAAINGARQELNLPAVRRNRKLDHVARQHSEQMRKQGRISHDSGHGDPAYRVENAGIRPKATGENVALAASAVRLHRALWASPSHRENMLLRRWDEVGVAVAEGEGGLLYATQLFIDSD
ncbi:MAG TPA: CAP domain-containing protein [Polyangiaceae bacterium]|nr:CAP domain-containing protein [Polyangiaceae bacterium]